MELIQLNSGDYFTLKPILDPKVSQVYVRGPWNPSTKKWICWKFNDINSISEFKDDKVVYTDFISY